MKKLFTLFAAMVTFVALNAQTVDYALVGFTIDGSSIVNEIPLGMNDDFNPGIVIKNNGPDVPAAADTIYIDLALEGQELGSLYLLGSQIAPLTAGQQTALGSETPLFTAAEMTQYGIEGTFHMCYTIRIVGAATDPNPSNNQACLTVNRGSSTGINEVAEGEVNVYPNPATTVINIDNAEGAQISLFDINGRMINNINSASANQTIDASNLAKGMYIVRIANGNNVITKKVNVVR